MKKPNIKTHPYMDGWSREGMTEEEENRHIQAREKLGLEVCFSENDISNRCPGCGKVNQWGELCPQCADRKTIARNQQPGAEAQRKTELERQRKALDKAIKNTIDYKSAKIMNEITAIRDDALANGHHTYYPQPDAAAAAISDLKDIQQEHMDITLFK